MSILNTFKTLAISVSILASAMVSAADIDMNADENDVAISGYDTVAYFTEGKPVKGRAKYSATFKNAIYQFSNKENRDLFKAEPKKYAPQFGGFCAMGVALTKKLDVDPYAWKIVDSKLYLNVNKKVQKSWLEEQSENIANAFQIWPDIQDLEANTL